MRFALLLLCLSPAILAVGCRGDQTSSQAPRSQMEGTSTAAGVSWLHSYEDALKQAAQDDKPLMVDVFAAWCGPCKRLDEEVFSRADVGEQSKQFVGVKVDGDNRRDLLQKLQVTGYPTTIFLAPDEKELTRVRGSVSYEDMLQAMSAALEKFEQGK